MHDHLDFARLTIRGVRHVDGVHHPADVVLLAVARRHQEIGLVDVEHVVLPGHVANRPLFDVAHLRLRVVAIRVPLLVVQVERVAVFGFRERDHAATDDVLLAEKRRSRLLAAPRRDGIARFAQPVGAP